LKSCHHTRTENNELSEDHEILQFKPCNVAKLQSSSSQEYRHPP
jgi:hypothetical protein